MSLDLLAAGVPGRGTPVTGSPCPSWLVFLPHTAAIRAPSALRRASLMAQLVKNLPAMQETQIQSLAEWGRSPVEGNGNQLQYSCLENPMDKGAW